MAARVGWVCAGKFEDLSEDEGVKVQLPSGKKKDTLALFLHQGKLFALENRCCHADKAIHKGDIEDLGACVIGKDGQKGTGGLCVQCPRHQKKFGGGLYFNLETGAARTPKITDKFRRLDRHRIKVHDVIVDAGYVYVSESPRRSPDEDEETSTSESSDSSDAICGKVKPAISDNSRGGGSKRLRENAEDYFWECRLEQVSQVNHDSYIFVLAHPPSDRLPPAPSSPIWHVTLQTKIGGRTVDREYTPVSTWAEWRDELRVRLLIKVYPDGLMTQFLAKLALGSVVQASAPQATLSAPSLMPCSHTLTAQVPAHLVLFAAGTGIVPMVQILSVAFEMRMRTVTLFYSNKSPADVLCWESIQDAARASTSHQRRESAFQMVLAFSTSGQAVVQKHWSPATVVCHRLDQKTIEQTLTSLPTREAIRAIASGPSGFFESMRDAFPLRLREVVTFVNLDE
eukprot:TRINITY_DN93640_c0_g1_i1.p1 TRINITY_DN93640_c0_g1~~TRINITY_DN93640_c0_g1_i1.p1  ORF type:complete len:456 (+),score=55.35 TRINITY_DN93640_c0_g1_i1:50-1417(+)